MVSPTKRPHVLLASNRLPVAVRVERGELVVTPGAGGVASGLRELTGPDSGRWIGWPGETWRLDAEQRRALDERLQALFAIPIELSATEVRRYADGFSNGVLWPIFHYALERLPADPGGWDEYRRVNERFAEAIVKEYRPGELIWIHDYQLMLVPDLVRQALPDAAIGFFLHVPFPTSELFRVLRWRRALLEGVLGATVVGFHTAAYAAHFISSAQKILGCPMAEGRIVIGGRQVRVVDLPMGIDASTYDSLARAPQVEREVARLHRLRPDMELLISVDRLDYTKGIPRRLLAFERFLERYPQWRGRVQLIQVAAPSRESVGAYQEFGRSVNELVGRINGRFTTLGHAPIHFLSRTQNRERLLALYQAASIALVTPLRDGMNLVAKEFVAARQDDDGVLVLSEFAGAAAELAGSIVVNPYDLDGVADAIAQALEMPLAERQERMRSLRARVLERDVHRWANDFLAALQAEHDRAGRMPVQDETFDQPRQVIATIRRSRSRITLVLDYDGTLVPLQARPDDARPDDELLQSLARLAARRDVAVHVSSGRRRAEVERWLGHLPIGLHAEHGIWSRTELGRWSSRLAERPAWLKAARKAMDERVRSVPGSMIEQKEASLVWHFRNARPEVAEPAAAALQNELEHALDSSDAAVVAGARIVEVRDARVHKGLVVKDVRREHPRTRLVVIGDDTTDEDMFAAAPPGAVTIKVGAGRTAARYRLAGPDQVRQLLDSLVRGLGKPRPARPEAA